MRVKFTHDQHRAVIKLILPVHLMPDIHAHAAPPDFALLERGRLVLGVQLFLMQKDFPGWDRQGSLFASHLHGTKHGAYTVGSSKIALPRMPD